MEPSRIDGLGFRLDVFDVKTGELALTHDFRPQTPQQKTWAAVAWVASLARPPAGSLWSYFGAHVEPRDANRLNAGGPFREPLLLGGSNTLLLVASVALGLLLAWSARRPLGRDPRERALRWTWTAAVFALSLPAWLLCRILAPSRFILAARTPRAGFGGAHGPPGGPCGAHQERSTRDTQARGSGPM